MSTSRRHFLTQTGLGVGAMALASLTQRATAAAHFAPSAKRIIYLFMAGGPSSVDLLDPKPKLRELNGQPCPESLVQGERFAFIKGTPKLLGSPYAFKQHGKSGGWVSELLPLFSEKVDEVATPGRTSPVR